MKLGNKVKILSGPFKGEEVSIIKKLSSFFGIDKYLVKINNKEIWIKQTDLEKEEE